MNHKPRTLKDALSGRISQALITQLPRAYDIIGKIGILEIPTCLEPHEAIIAKTLLEISPSIITVCKKIGGHTGRFRRQHIKILAGKRSKTTIHTENGVRLKVHVEDAYFSPRLANERWRIANLVKNKERVLVMFSGIAPYPLAIAKLGRALSISGVEINPKAHKLALENISLNKNFSRTITLYCGDARKVVPRLHQTFDRIVMPLPKGASSYFNAALAASKPGTIIHYYTFAPEKEIDRAAVFALVEIRKLGHDAVAVGTVRCGQSRVREFRVCVDLKISAYI